MGRNGKNKLKTAISNSSQSNALKAKKMKNIFKVTEPKYNKKPKEVQSKLKKIKAEINTKREKIDAYFKELHPSLVIKKSKNSQQQQKRSIKSTKKPTVNSEIVSDTLEKCKI